MSNYIIIQPNKTHKEWTVEVSPPPRYVTKSTLQLLSNASRRKLETTAHLVLLRFSFAFPLTRPRSAPRPCYWTRPLPTAYRSRKQRRIWKRNRENRRSRLPHRNYCSVRAPHRSSKRNSKDRTGTCRVCCCHSLCFY